MKVAVRHRLELVEHLNDVPGSAELKLPIREADAVMGESVTAYLDRVGWRFDLPTVCIIGGEFYGRDEWPTCHLALNDDVEFVSRPAGPSGSGGSALKTVASVVALVTLTAVAGPISTALLPTLVLGTAPAAFASAAIIGAAAASPLLFTRPRRPWWRRALAAARDCTRRVAALALGARSLAS